MSITLNSPWYEYVRDGLKKYEGRCNWKMVKDLKIGDHLLISHHTNRNLPTYKVKIIDLLYFSDFEEALNKLTLSEVLPGILTIADGVEIYKKYYKLQTQKENGVCIIKIMHVI